MEKTDFLPTLLIGMYGDLMSTHYRVNVIDYLIDIKQKLGLEYGKIKRTESRFFTLLPCDEAVSLKDAAQAVGIQYKNLNKYLNGLIKNGYFEKFYDNEKARIMLKMTDKGKEILNENSLVCAAIMQERISCSLTREEAYDFAETLRKAVLYLNKLGPLSSGAAPQVSAEGLEKMSEAILEAKKKYSIDSEFVSRHKSFPEVNM
ncbi:MAG: hypothetical protein ACLU1U_05005 [Lachnospiraceae bacterium]